jgi:hypothetical protein
VSPIWFLRDFFARSVYVVVLPIAMSYLIL